MYDGPIQNITWFVEDENGERVQMTTPTLAIRYVPSVSFYFYGGGLGWGGVTSSFEYSEGIYLLRTGHGIFGDVELIKLN